MARNRASIDSDNVLSVNATATSLPRANTSKGNYYPLHRGIDHSANSFRLPGITKNEFIQLNAQTFDNPPLVKGILIPIEENKILPTWEDFKNKKLLRDFTVSPYHEINWRLPIYNRMPRDVRRYKRTFEGTEMGIKPEFRDIVKTRENFSFRNLEEYDKKLLELEQNNTSENMDAFNNIGNAFSGGVSFGNQSDNVKNIPILIFGVAVIFLLSVTGVFGKIFGGKKKRR